jgi:glycerophosphoryl diester phosphodiesterase
MRHPFFAIPRPIVFGHRGACGERPENTLASFERALAQGAAVIETDVHRTRDGVVVVLHDPDLTRTTDGSGAVAEHDFAELQTLDAGFRFTSGDGAFPFRGTGIRVPTLAEAFARFPGVRFNVEVKPTDRALVRATLGLVREHAREGLTLIAAEREDAMALVHEEIAATGIEPALGASVSDVLGFVRAAVEGREPPPRPMALQIPPAFVGRPLVTRELLDFAHAHDVQVHVWTVNEPAEMKRLLALGVDGVMSDFPGRLRACVDALRGG